MTYNIVTDDGIRNFLLSFINLRTKNDSEQELTPFVNAIKRFLETFPDREKLQDESYKFTKEAREQIFNIANEFFMDSDGGLISDIDAINDMRNFRDEPGEICIDDSLVSGFLDKVDNMSLTGFSNYEKALRFYFGHVKMATKPNKYGVLVVPICSPKVSLGQKRDHTLDREDELFKKNPLPFALAVSDLSKGIIDNKGRLFNKITLNKDHLSITELSYYSLERFEGFRNGTDSVRRDKMCIFFAREAKDKSIKSIISFLDNQDVRLESSFLKSGIPTVGITNSGLFDQGDLIPPPSPVADKSF